MLYTDHRTLPGRIDEPKLKDLNSGELVDVLSPASFELETVLLDTAYYKFRGREYRFQLSKARELGLKIA